MSADNEIWQIMVAGEIYELDTATIHQWIFDGRLQSVDKVRKGNESWVNASRIPALKEVFTAVKQQKQGNSLEVQGNHIQQIIASAPAPANPSIPPPATPSALSPTNPSSAPFSKPSTPFGDGGSPAFNKPSSPKLNVPAGNPFANPSGSPFNKPSTPFGQSNSHNPFSNNAQTANPIVHASDNQATLEDLGYNYASETAAQPLAPQYAEPPAYHESAPYGEATEYPEAAYPDSQYAEPAPAPPAPAGTVYEGPVVDIPVYQEEAPVAPTNTVFEGTAPPIPEYKPYEVEQRAKAVAAVQKVNLEEFLHKMRSEQRFGRAIVGGLITMILTAFIWSVIGAAVNSGAPLLAPFLGYLVGDGVRRSGRGIDLSFSVVACIYTLIGCVGGQLLALAFIAGRKVHNVDFPAGLKFYIGHVGGAEAVLYAIGLYMAYNFSLRTDTE